MRVSVGSVATLASLAVPALSWGEFGHEITATIAQIHLYPSTRDSICKILPGTYKCHLAGVASWPDIIKVDPKINKFSSWHFVNGKNDYPPENCDFSNLILPEDILDGIVNTTNLIGNTTSDRHDRDFALRFLVHFLGDIHQPFHLTGRDRGANNINVLYNKYKTKLHAVWDDSLIEDMVVHLPNYTDPLPTTVESTRSPSELARNLRVESSLQGRPYDSYIRWILLEGIYNWWAGDLRKWTTCPQNTGSQIHSIRGQKVLEKPPFDDPVGLPVCPYHWASQTHPLLCGFIWPADLNNTSEPREINTPEYGDRVRDEKIVEKQLALGGIRLAGVLNALLGSEEDKGIYGTVPLLL